MVVGGRRFWAYGNEALLEVPVRVAIKGHRREREGAADAAHGKTREELLAEAGRIGPGGAGISTFLSPLEKEAGNEIVRAGGALVLLSMEGFGERWHPPERQERLCAEGRLLCLSPYEPQGAKLTRREMHERAHGLVEWALEHADVRLEGWLR